MRKPPLQLAAPALSLIILATARAGAQPQPSSASPGLGEATTPAPPLPPLGPLPPGLIPPSTVVAAPAPIATPLDAGSSTIAPSGPTSSWEVEFAGYVGFTSISQGSSYVGATESSLHGSGEVSLERFLAPVVDDDTPRTLQPYLQRASTIAASVTAGGFSTTESEVTGSRGDLNLRVGATADIYITPYLALTGAFSYTYDELQDSLGSSATTVPVDTTHSFSPAGGVGVRLGDVRFDVSYAGLIQTTSSANPGNWGTITLSAEAVVARRLQLELTLSAFHAGAGVSVFADYFVKKSFGVFVGGVGAVGAYYNEPEQHDDYGFNVGVGFWPLPRLRFVAEYALTGHADSLPGAPSAFAYQLDNTAYVSALVRVP